jgi:hypothetical protein
MTDKPVVVKMSKEDRLLKCIEDWKHFYSTIEPATMEGRLIKQTVGYLAELNHFRLTGKPPMNKIEMDEGVPSKDRMN